jgi:leukocyte immunoglobulin-like receptor
MVHLWGLCGNVRTFNTLSTSLLEVYNKSSLSALPSPVMTSGGNVILQCVSWQRLDCFILLKEGEHMLSLALDSQQYPYEYFQVLSPSWPCDPEPQVDIQMLQL